MTARRRESLDAAVSPAYFSASKRKTGCEGSTGLSLHTSSARSLSERIFTCFPERSLAISLPCASFTHLPSKPRVSPSRIVLRRNSCSVGTPGSPMRCSIMPLPSSSCSAWMKNLPSTHRSASSFVTTSVAFSPVNPEKYSLTLK